MEKALEKLDSILQHVSATRVFLVLLLALGLVIVYAMFENRQKIYKGVIEQPIVGDYRLEKPTSKGAQLVKQFVDTHRDVGLITIIDADPLSNQRIPVHRTFGDEDIRKIIEANGDDVAAGTGPLFNSDTTNNQQMLALMNGEMICGPASQGMFLKIFEQAGKKITYSCRVPLPPAYRKTTGWFSIHMYRQPEDMDKFKFDALNMSLTYYNMEIASKEPNPSVTGR